MRQQKPEPLFGVVLVKKKGSRCQKKTTKTIDKKFSKRQQARQWCRNNWYQYDHNGMEITHPDKENEAFSWQGIFDKR